MTTFLTEYQKDAAKAICGLVPSLISGTADIVALPLCDCGLPIPFGTGPCKCGIVWDLPYPVAKRCLGLEAENIDPAITGKENEK